jgi:predicted RNase H-like HicB family nuclease
VRVSKEALRDAVQLLRDARNNIEDAIDNIVDAMTSGQEVYRKYAAKLIEAAVTELSEALKLVKGVMERE